LGAEIKTKLCLRKYLILFSIFHSCFLISSCSDSSQIFSSKKNILTIEEAALFDPLLAVLKEKHPEGVAYLSYADNLIHDPIINFEIWVRPSYSLIYSREIKRKSKKQFILGQPVIHYFEIKQLDLENGSIKYNQNQGIISDEDVRFFLKTGDLRLPKASESQNRENYDNLVIYWNKWILPRHR